MYDNEKKYLLKGMDYMPENGWLAGGALTSTFSNNPIRDYDLYFPDEESFKSTVKDLYGEEEGEIISRWHQPEMWCVDITSRSITFVNGGAVYQLMHFKWFKSAQEIFDSFDFTACMGAYSFANKDLILDDRFLPDLARRQLVFNKGTAFPLASAIRIGKYLKKGFSITQREHLKVLSAILFKNINSWESLAEQIGGSYGESVGLDTSKPFNLDNVISAINGAAFEDNNEPRVDSQIEHIDRHIASNSEEAFNIIKGFKRENV